MTCPGWSQWSVLYGERHVYMYVRIVKAGCHLVAIAQVVLTA